MIEPAPTPAQRRLDAIRSRVNQASPAWGLIADGRLTMTAGDGKDLAPVLTFADGVYIEDQELVVHAPDDLSWLLDRYDRAVAKLRALEPTDPGPAVDKNPYAKACAILCGKHLFRQFLAAEYGLDVADDERVRTKVRFILDVQSRAELDTNSEARERWFSLVKHYETWQKGGRK